ncbi:cysteine hydrolase family protein [Nonomuraea sp. NPDC050022]|uniref:cysteine hydrolase family protein n=1 Tax=Nonomuraea sp. NPDC050022 TaxID=3364358 RepID=UPI0037A9C5C9
MTTRKSTVIPAAANDAAGRRAALLVIDMQNDFCLSDSSGSGRPLDRATVPAVVENTRRSVGVARQAGVEVIFVRFLGDEKYQGPSWRERNRRLGKRPRCREHTWGAEFHRVEPAPGERVFTKRAHFDAFLTAGFEEYLASRGVSTVVLAGLYSDVCVDSTARTAFQKGYHVTVLSDCTTSLHLDPAAVLRFMEVLYGARITSWEEMARTGLWATEPAG